MSYRYHGRAFTDATAPRAYGICDRCGFQYNLYQLQYQYQYNGTTLYNTRYRVCPTCMDIPQPQLLNPILPPDPIAVIDPRPPAYSVNEAGPVQDLYAELLTPQASIPDFYLDLFDGNPLQGGTSILAALTGSSTRTNFTASMGAPVNNVTVNTEDITFTTYALTSVQASWLAVYDAASGGVLLMMGELMPGQTLVFRNGVAFPAGNLQVTLLTTALYDDNGDLLLDDDDTTFLTDDPV